MIITQFKRLNIYRINTDSESVVFIREGCVKFRVKARVTGLLMCIISSLSLNKYKSVLPNKSTHCHRTSQLIVIEQVNSLSSNKAIHCHQTSTSHYHRTRQTKGIIPHDKQNNRKKIKNKTAKQNHSR